MKFCKNGIVKLLFNDLSEAKMQCGRAFAVAKRRSFYLSLVFYIDKAKIKILLNARLLFIDPKRIRSVSDIMRWERSVARFNFETKWRRLNRRVFFAIKSRKLARSAFSSVLFLKIVLYQRKKDFVKRESFTKLCNEVCIIWMKFCKNGIVKLLFNDLSEAKMQCGRAFFYYKKSGEVFIWARYFILIKRR